MRFYIREHVDELPVNLRQTRSGSARVSTRATTLLDVSNDPSVVGGLDNVANIIIELCETDEVFMPELLDAANCYPASALRRLGWILENHTDHDELENLRETALARASGPSKLDPAGAFSGSLDEGWNIYINRRIEPDV
jgi:predicted transcriptional regulator of viral defense system